MAKLGGTWHISMQDMHVRAQHDKQCNFSKRLDLPHASKAANDGWESIIVGASNHTDQSAHASKNQMAAPVKGTAADSKLTCWALGFRQEGRIACQ